MQRVAPLINCQLLRRWRRRRWRRRLLGASSLIRRSCGLVAVSVRLNDALRTSLSHESLTSEAEARQAEQRQQLTEAHDAELRRVRAQLEAEQRRSEQRQTASAEERRAKEAVRGRLAYLVTAGCTRVAAAQQ